MSAKDGGGKGRLFTAGLVAAWYSSNIGVLLLNKYLLSNYGFKYPIFLTMCHMASCSLFSCAAIAWLRVVPMQLPRSRLQLAKIAALSAVFCASVVSGNVSLRYLPVSFNQAVGATTPFFTAVFAYIMTLKRESFLTYLALVPVVTGVIIASGVSVCVCVFYPPLFYSLEKTKKKNWIAFPPYSGKEEQKMNLTKEKNSHYRESLAFISSDSSCALERLLQGHSRQSCKGFLCLLRGITHASLSLSRFFKKEKSDFL
jgi:hypothetical protein